MEMTINRELLGLYLYMGNSDKIIKMLEEVGVTTWEEAQEILVPSVKSNIRDRFQHEGSSLAGTSNASTRIKEYFESKMKSQ